MKHSIFDCAGMIPLNVFIECCEQCDVPYNQGKHNLYVDYKHQFQIIEKWGTQYVLCECLNSHGTKIGKLVESCPQLKSCLEGIDFQSFEGLEEILK